jgi:hypothetical protein
MIDTLIVFGFAISWSQVIFYLIRSVMYENPTKKELVSNTTLLVVFCVLGVCLVPLLAKIIWRY